jgi:hypothetical protein
MGGGRRVLVMVMGAAVAMCVMASCASGSDSTRQASATTSSTTSDLVLLGPASGDGQTADTLLITYFVGLSNGEVDLVLGTLCGDVDEAEVLIASFQHDERELGYTYLIGSTPDGAREGRVPFEMVTDDGDVSMIATIERQPSGDLCLVEALPATSTAPES